MSRGPARSTEPIEVVAGILRDDRGRILLAQRPEGKHLAGTWEFPGGKREAGETARQALAREMAEELGVAVGSASPWLALTHRYPEVTVRLQLYTVDDWSGLPHGREGQPLKWVAQQSMSRLPMPAADRPIVRALGLDHRYAISPGPAEPGGAAGLMDWARDCLGDGIRLLQLHADFVAAAAFEDLARDFGRLVAGSGGKWLLDGPPELAVQVGADGVCLDAGRLSGLSLRPLSRDFLVAASCRDEVELARAGNLALDFITLSPVCTGSKALGWDGFERLCRLSPLPVYALGGMVQADLERVRACGGFGVAGRYGSGSRR